MLRKLKKNPVKEEKKPRKVKMQELFIQAAKNVELTLNYMHDAICALCDDNMEDVKKFCDLTVKIEQKADRIFEQISARMFTREVMVFSRADRLYLAKHIDQVIDATETVARRILIHKPKLFPELNEMLKDAAGKGKKIGQYLTKALIKIFDDFDETEKLADQIQRTRHEARDVEYVFLEKLYGIETEYTDLVYYDQLIKKILSAINKAENFGDGLRGLVWKYRY